MFIARTFPQKSITEWLRWKLNSFIREKHTFRLSILLFRVFTTFFFFFYLLAASFSFCSEIKNLICVQFNSVYSPVVLFVLKSWKIIFRKTNSFPLPTYHVKSKTSLRKKKNLLWFFGKLFRKLSSGCLGDIALIPLSSFAFICAGLLKLVFVHLAPSYMSCVLFFYSFFNASHLSDFWRQEAFVENKNKRRKCDRKHAGKQFILVTWKKWHKLKCHSMSSSAVCTR